MNIEDRLRAKLNQAGASPPSDGGGLATFLQRAHRRVVVRRAVAAVTSAVVLGIGAVGATVLMGSDRTTGLPPIDRATQPDRETKDRPPRDEVLPPVCRAAPFESGDLGAVAYVRDQAVHVVDVESGADRVVVGGIGTHRRVSGDDGINDLKWSPDGRWLLANGGTIIPAGGGAMCAPLGSDVDGGKWVRGSDATFVATTKIGGLVVGGPGRDRREILPDDWGAQDFILDPDGRLALVQRTYGGRPGLYIVDLQSGEARPLFLPLESDRIYPRPATWSPDGQWVFFWRIHATSVSTALEGGPLWAIPISGGDPIEIIPKMFFSRDFLTWCGNTLVSAAGGGRLATDRKRLMTTTIPDMRTEPLTTDDSRSFFSPDCSPSTDAVAATWTSVVGGEAGQSAVTVLSFPEGEEEHVPASLAASGSRAPQWSADGERILFVQTPEGDRSPKVVLSDWKSDEGDTEDMSTEIADLGDTAAGYDGTSETQRFDWYQP